MVNDPISDLLTQISNAYKAKKHVLSVSHSKVKEEIVKILEKKEYIKTADVRDQTSENKTKKRKVIEIKLLYKENKPAMENVKRVSAPGRKLYVDKYHIPTVLSGFGTVIISTSEGLMTGAQAHKKGIGGEVICFIW